MGYSDKDHISVDYPPHYTTVDHPPHYTNGKIECIDAIKASMTPIEFKGYLKGNVMKYLWRYQLKFDPKTDLEKAAWYLKRLKNEEV